MKKTCLSILLVFCIGFAHAQDFGNEWINHSQEYYKVKVGQDGFYRLTFNYLKQEGLPVSSIQPSGIQLFYRGKEVALHFHDDNNDQVFNTNDFIEFYGVKNNGELDQALYENPSDQAHPYTSFFSDTSVYMLTWDNAVVGKRIKNYYKPDYSGLTDSFLEHTQTLVFEEEWYDGVQNLEFSDQSVSTIGEGYMTSRITPRGRDIVFNVPHFQPSSVQATLRLKAHGKSNPDIYVGGSNHHLQVKHNGSSRVLGILKNNGYYNTEKTYTLTNSEITPLIVLNFESQASTFDNSALSIVELNYSRAMTLDKQKSLQFKHKGQTLLELGDVATSSQDIFLYDIQREQKIKGDILNDTVRFNLDYKTTSDYSDFYLWDSTVFVTYSGGLQKVNFLNVNPSGNFSYLIITNEKLRASAEQYSSYRKSVDGREFKTLLATTDQLYNEFFYGNHHPLALKNFCRYYYNKQSTAPENVLIIGKGSMYSRLKEPGILEGSDLVPTIGVPPSDNLIVSGLGSNPQSLSIDIPIGRIPADESKEVLDYLSKLIEYEKNLNASYKKKVLHIAGGATKTENLLLQKALQKYADIMGGKEFGGWRTLVSKSTAATVSVEHKEEIQSHINGGISLITYFGHGSSNVLDVEIGKASELQNNGKYPIFYFNGCVLGNTFAQNSLCEQYLFEADKGAIAWLASTSVGLISYLDDYSMDFHRIAFQQEYGNTLGSWTANTTKTFLKPGLLYNERQTTQFVLHGDPALQLFNAQSPDYSLEQDKITILEDALKIAETDSFTMLLPALNYGKATDDTLVISVSLESSSGTKFYFTPRSFTGIYSKKDLTFGISLEDLKINGLIKINIELDSANKVVEKGPLGELNNSFQHEYFLSLTGVNTLFPVENSIINNTEVTVQAQNSDLFAGEVEYFIELDTTPLFNSPTLQRSGLKRGTFLLDHKFNLLPTDSTDYFWRCRLNLPMEEGGEWNMSSFTMIYLSPTGWSEGYYTKFQNSTFDQLLIDDQTRTWRFATTTADPLEIWTSGGNDVARKYGRKFLTQHSFATCDWTNYDGIELMAINPKNEQRYDERLNPYNTKAYTFWCPPPSGFEKYYTQDSTTGEYRYNTRDSAVRDSLVAFLKRIPKGYHLMVKNGWTMGIEDWGSDLFDAFEEFGIIGLRNQKEYYPFAIFGQKGAPAGSAQEHYADTNLIEDPTTQGIKAGKLISTLLTEGSVKSKRIGPSSKWTSAHFSVDGVDHKKDKIEYIVWGFNTKDSLVELAKGNTLNYSLSSVSVADFPYLQLEIKFKDPALRTPIQVRRWTVLFEGVPEGSIEPNLAFEVHNDTIAQGDSIKLKIAFKNISNLDMDSILVQYQLDNNSYSYDSLVMMDTLAASNYMVLKHTFATEQLVDDVKLKVVVNPKFAQPELSLDNNIFFKNIVISQDKKNPILDVLFDGVHIMNMDIVHAKPVITLSANDDNPFLLLDDPSYFTLSLRNVVDAQFTSIDLNGPDITFSPQPSAAKNATIEFRPTNLKSGTYELSAQVKDRSGNEQPNQYSIRFQIISESKISNVYPYPNPFTSQTRFVFTLTGEVIPEDMSITIMNVRGQTVKEISAAELGPLKIGNNITDFAWDGTDNYGDKLANGVYFYKVNMGIDKADFEHFETAADNLNLFQQGLGKLYIAR
jgi:hypothetical protein